MTGSASQSQDEALLARIEQDLAGIAAALRELDREAEDPEALPPRRRLGPDGEIRF